jgi:phospholipid transport system substrate-binding protein
MNPYRPLTFDKGSLKTMKTTLKTRSLVGLFLCLMAAVLIVVPVTAQAATKSASSSATMPEGAKNFVASMGQQALDFLADKNLGQAGKEDAFRKLLERSFDMATIGRFALGQYWRQMSPQQQTEYQKLFRDHVVRVYSARFNEYSGQTFETTGARADNDIDSIVTSQIKQPQGEPVDVDWRVRYKSGKYQIVDVMVEGVSMTMTQRSDFASVIQRGGGDVSVILTQLKSAN